MRLFIPLCFVLLGVLYWVVSGGPGFVPEAGPRQTASTGSADPALVDPSTAPSTGAPVDDLAGASDVAVTRAESPVSDLVAPPPEPGALTIEPATAAPGEATRAEVQAAEVQAAVVPEPAAGPEGLPETPVAPDEALAALAPDLAPDLPAPPPAATDAGPAPLVEAASTSAAPALREVAGDRVNLREGPGTTFDVVGRLARGEAAEVMESRDGWARVRVGANEGWMSERFLAP